MKEFFDEVIAASNEPILDGYWTGTDSEGNFYATLTPQLQALRPGDTLSNKKILAIGPYFHKNKSEPWFLKGKVEK